MSVPIYWGMPSSLRGRYAYGIEDGEVASLDCLFFRYLSRVSGLTLNTNKLRFIMITSKRSLQVTETFRNRLLTKSRNFASTSFGYNFKHLGIYLAPEPLHLNWTNQIATFYQRVAAVAIAVCAALIVFPMHSSRISPFVRTSDNWSHLTLA